jgi:hypothetical protein
LRTWLLGSRGNDDFVLNDQGAAMGRHVLSHLEFFTSWQCPSGLNAAE